MKLSRILQVVIVTAGLCLSALAWAAGATVVYHINDSANTRVLLGNVANHLAAAPDTRIHVVANGGGIEFLLKDASDGNGRPYAPAVQFLAGKGVAFKLCRNTLTARKIGEDAVVPEASIVPAGVVEIARLQIEEKAAYIKP
jgi:intracellular sulfur oxidation DsrE/DsrF family protein